MMYVNVLLLDVIADGRELAHSIMERRIRTIITLVLSSTITTQVVVLYVVSGESTVTLLQVLVEQNI